MFAFTNEGGETFLISGRNFSPFNGATVSAVLTTVLDDTSFNAVNCNVAKAHELIQCDTRDGLGADTTVSISVEGIDSAGTFISHCSFSCFIRV